MKYYTLIGSRKTPENILELLKKLATKLDRKGWTVRSGGANGADNCADHVENKEVYLPWDGFNGHYKDCKLGYIVYSDLQRKHEASAHASLHHKYWNTTKKEAVKHLHRRNMFQVLGRTLNKKSSFVLVWAEPDSERGEGHVRGGTGSAVSLALSFDIPVFNLYYQDVQDKMKKFIGE
jgi:hypothetical protein